MTRKFRSCSVLTPAAASKVNLRFKPNYNLFFFFPESRSFSLDSESEDKDIVITKENGKRIMNTQNLTFFKADLFNMLKDENANKMFTKIW
jgi:hypothetical protein